MEDLADRLYYDGVFGIEISAEEKMVKVPGPLVKKIRESGTDVCQWVSDAVSLIRLVSKGKIFVGGGEKFSKLSLFNIKPYTARCGDGFIKVPLSSLQVSRMKLEMGGNFETFKKKALTLGARVLENPDLSFYDQWGGRLFPFPKPC